LLGIEQWIEGDKISILAYTTLGSIGGIGATRRRHHGLAPFVVSELLLALEGYRSKDGSATRGKSVMLNSLRKVLPGAVVRRNVVTSAALPEKRSRLLLAPLAKAIKELVVAAQVSHIHLPVPVVFVLGVLHSENLEREMGATVDAMDISTTGVLDRLTKPAGVHKSHLRLAPERNQASKLGRNVVVDDSLHSPLVGPNGLINVSHLHQEVNLIFTS
jgi:hypothetical protein